MPARMRFPQQALEELRKTDPDTQISLNYIRSLAKCGLVPCVQIGRRRLLNYDALLDFLEHPTEIQPESVQGVRRIAE